MNYLKDRCLHLSSITLKVILDSYSRSNVMVDVQRVANDIGARIEKAIWFEYERRRLDPDDAA